MASLALALVMVLGMVPNFAMKANAAVSATVTVSGLTYTVSVISATDRTGNDAISEITGIKFYGDETRSGNQVKITKVELTGYIGSTTITFRDSDCTASVSATSTASAGNDKLGYLTAVLSITRSAASHTGGTCVNPVCTRCGKSYTVPCNYGDWVSDGTYHWKVCTRDSSHLSEKVACSGGAATCIAQATCSTCGNAYGSINSSAHQWEADWRMDGGNSHFRLCKLNIDHEQRYACTYNGTPNCSKMVYCDTCGREKTAPNDHDWGTWVSNGDNTHTRTCTRNAAHTQTADCSGDTKANCTQKGTCTTCGGAYNNPQSHSYTYTASGSTITETCVNGCGHSETAILNASAEYSYTGSDMKPATITYSNGWRGAKAADTAITYSNNLDVGTATASATIEGQTATKTFEITAADISGATVTLDPASGTYTGSAYTPDVTVTFDGFGTLDKDTYTLSWDKNGFITPDTYTVTVEGTGNFTGTKTQTFNINAATFTDIKVEQVGTLTYDGTAQTPAVSASAVAVNDQPVTFTYSTEESGPYGAMPSFTVAGNHTVYYKASAPNHNDAAGSFTVTIAKQEVTPPTIATKPYTGSAQTAEVSDTERYTVTRNDGGTEGGDYDVVLTLTDASNYCWPGNYQSQISGDNSENLTLKFTITAIGNAWVTEPSISGWTYGETAAEPDMGHPQSGNATVNYVGTTNGGAAYNNTIAPTEAGEYKAVFTVEATNSYNVLTKEVPFTIARATPSADGFTYTEPSLTYNGLDQSVTVESKLDGVDQKHITLNYSKPPRDAGDYTFAVSVAQSSNYEASAAPLTRDDWKFTIQKAEPTINWEETEFTYNTHPQGEATVELTNNETYSGTVTYSHKKGEEEAVYGLPADVGTYKISASIPEQANYTAAEAAQTVTIKAKEVTPTVVLTPDFCTFDNQPKQPAVKVLDGETEISASEYEVTYGNNTAVGAANVWITDKTGGNYVIAQNTKGVFLILPDTSPLDGVTTANVTSDHADEIDAIQALMNGKDITAASEAAQEAWNAIAERCTGLEAAITNAATKSEEITNETAALPEQPKTSDLDTIKDILDTYDSIKGNLTEEEKAELADEIEKLTDLKDAIEDTNADLKEITDGVGALNKEDLDFADKATIQTLQNKTDALDDNIYLTEEDKQALTDAENKLAELRAEFTEADKVTEQLNKLPITANPDSKTAVEAYEAAQKAYEALGEDKSKVDPAAVQKLEALKNALTAYKITKGNGAKWVKGSGTGLSFTANGYFPKFTGVKVDGVTLSTEDYTAASGSTVVTLGADYLKTLKTGKHTISIVYTDGEATGEFRVVTYNGNPFTGDQIMIAAAVMTLSAVALSVLLAMKKKRKK